MYVFTYLQIHVWNLRLAFGSSVLIKKGKSMGLWIHLFLELIKIQEEIKTKLNRKDTKVWRNIYHVHRTLSLSSTYKIHDFLFLMLDIHSTIGKLNKQNPELCFRWTLYTFIEIVIYLVFWGFITFIQNYKTSLQKIQSTNFKDSA